MIFCFQLKKKKRNSDPDKNAPRSEELQNQNDLLL